MPLSWNEIRDRAVAFSRDWSHAESEDADAKSFWDAFFDVFGVPRRRVATFEKRVVHRDGKEGFIDLLWKGVLLVEHKSRGKDLDRASKQARDYFPGLKDRDLPRYILVSDFARFRLYDLERGTTNEFRLAQLKDRLKLFGFIAGYQVQEIKPQDPVNVKAAEQMGRLHDLLKASGYAGHPLELLLVRILFCLFADDTGIFQPAQAFRAWLEERTAEDGSDLGPRLAQFFQILDTPDRERSKALDEQLAAFPYVNGRLFEERLPLAAFDAKMRETLLDCCGLDWSAISPAIFGALFQSIMDAKARRNLGAHYTSEENILKLIKPLFLDDLWAEFERVKGNRNRLFEFHKKLRALTFFDPACGCGNFLVISYRELRRLELELLRVVYQSDLDRGQRHLDVHQQITLNVDQFFGIEIEEFPAQIAQVALWLIDHQMNVAASDEFGQYFARIPLVATPHIVNGNALRLDWSSILSPEHCSYLLGNPPFSGSKLLTDEQRTYMRAATAGLRNQGVLDFVAAWYVLAAHYTKSGSAQCAFVSTNSITQGEQVAALWPWLLSQGIVIRFAHRTFQWTNEARGVAAVHCVIIGFGRHDVRRKTIYEYGDIRGEPHAVEAANINPYLIDAPDTIVEGRLHPVSAPLPIVNGSIPADGGHLILEPADRDALLQWEPAASAYLRRYLGADGFINGTARYCLWLVDCPPADLRKMPHVIERVQSVRSMRESSDKAATRARASIPMLFTENRQPSGGQYLAIPRTSSENRRYLPIGFLDAEVIAANDLQMVPKATPYHFGILSSAMHMAWTRVTAGRLKSDLRYSAKFTYNTFPWPDSPLDALSSKIADAARAVLDARAAHPGATLADLYDPLAMPPDLMKAHQKLDSAVDAAYGRKGFRNDAERVAFLFDLYGKYTSLLPAPARPSKAKRAKA